MTAAYRCACMADCYDERKDGTLHFLQRFTYRRSLPLSFTLTNAFCQVAGETAAAETLEQPSKIEETAEPTHEEKTVQATPEIASTETENEDSEDDDSEAESEEKEDDDAIENIYEEEEESVPPSGSTFCSREHIDVILGLDEIGTKLEKEEEKK
ncbi:UNVERIFIED_CONTAM: hypothetical protein NCL1_24118 [Trichonephila clavipes]